MTTQTTPNIIRNLKELDALVSEFMQPYFNNDEDTTLSLFTAVNAAVASAFGVDDRPYLRFTFGSRVVTFVTTDGREIERTVEVLNIFNGGLNALEQFAQLTFPIDPADVVLLVNGFGRDDDEEFDEGDEEIHDGEQYTWVMMPAPFCVAPKLEAGMELPPFGSEANPLFSRIGGGYWETIWENEGNLSRAEQEEEESEE